MKFTEHERELLQEELNELAEKMQYDEFAGENYDQKIQDIDHEIEELSAKLDQLRSEKQYYLDKNAKENLKFRILKELLEQ